MIMLTIFYSGTTEYIIIHYTTPEKPCYNSKFVMVGIENSDHKIHFIISYKKYSPESQESWFLGWILFTNHIPVVVNEWCQRIHDALTCTLFV